MPAPRRRSLNIPLQLRALSLPDFVGRQHSGIDVSNLDLFYLPRTTLIYLIHVHVVATGYLYFIFA